MKRKPSDLSNKETIETLDALYTAASSVKGRDAVKLFLRDLLTRGERIMLGRRIVVARMLLQGKSYNTIRARLRIGKATIGRIHHWLHDQLPGYEQAVRGMERELEKRKNRSEMAYGSFSFSALKRKYPLHFLLFPAQKRKSKKL